MSSRAITQHKLYPADWKFIAWKIKNRSDWRCEGCGHAHSGSPYVLTVHHIDFNPQNNEDDNLIALCQRCHLRVQGMMSQPRTRLEVIKRLETQGRQLYFR